MKIFSKMTNKNTLDTERYGKVSSSEEMLNLLLTKLEFEKAKNVILLQMISELEHKKEKHQNIVDLNKNEISLLKYQIDEIIKDNKKKGLSF